MYIPNFQNKVSGLVIFNVEVVRLGAIEWIIEYVQTKYIRA
jgi:hypothetical protein